MRKLSPSHPHLPRGFRKEVISDSHGVLALQVKPCKLIIGVVLGRVEGGGHLVEKCTLISL